jgi:hypothetical protein
VGNTIRSDTTERYEVREHFQILIPGDAGTAVPQVRAALVERFQMVAGSLLSDSQDVTVLGSASVKLTGAEADDV